MRDAILLLTFYTIMDTTKQPENMTREELLQLVHEQQKLIHTQQNEIVASRFVIGIAKALNALPMQYDTNPFSPRLMTAYQNRLILVRSMQSCKSCCLKYF